MPTPLIELQRRLAIVGAIRAGGEKQPNAPGRKLEAYRLTSARRELIEQAAALYGGTVSPWKTNTGEQWQVYTEADELPVLVIPHYSIKQTYELWEGATKRLRLCDGEEEQLTGQPCLCEAEGVDRCDLYTRLVVALPELDTVLGWRLITKGINAAHELPTILAMMEAQGGTFVPAKLRLDQRRGVKDGQVLRYVVPTLDGYAGYLALARPENGRRELESGFAPRREPTVEEALGAVEPSADTSPARRTADFGKGIEPRALDTAEQPATPPPTPEVHEPQEGLPELREEPEPEPPPEPEPKPERVAKPPKPNKAQKTRMDILVTKLSEGGHLDKARIYDAIAGLRGVGGEDLVLQLGGYDDDLVLHWSPLRDALTAQEASQLIAWLEAKELRVAAPPAAES